MPTATVLPPGVPDFLLGALVLLLVLLVSHHTLSYYAMHHSLFGGENSGVPDTSVLAASRDTAY